jgi:hypothetical protein
VQASMTSHIKRHVPIIKRSPGRDRRDTRRSPDRDRDYRRVQKNDKRIDNSRRDKRVESKNKNERGGQERGGQASSRGGQASSR